MPFSPDLQALILIQIKRLFTDCKKTRHLMQRRIVLPDDRGGWENEEGTPVLFLFKPPTWQVKMYAGITVELLRPSQRMESGKARQKGINAEGIFLTFFSQLRPKRLQIATPIS